ncbi:lysosome-associated membrane glycoprotein 1-like [Coccinella septempunctata]|uniref:lysosome-associated membrane glycoprotein 1-like n=1 Tax=Coccinella septempunctata TaxID=41139 RepID=UPI001D085B5D|nr:lysosome-associated membrane glycoprotein 1-like [Coccinella septempunctata]
MKLFKFILVLVLCVITEAIQVVPVGPPGNGSTPAPAPPTSTPTSTPKPSTPPAPTTAPTTASTTKPTTTTTKPTTTTEPTTTKAPPTTSKTTPVPTTTAKPPSTTPAPNPGDPVVGSWNITKPGTDIKCIMSKMALQIEVDYEEKNKTTKAVLDVPANATANGTCDNDKRNVLLLTWTDGNSTNSITFSFFNNTNTSQISLDNILVNLNGLHDTDPMNFMYNRSVFEAPLKHSYKCNKDQTLTLTNSKNDSNCKATLKVSHLQIQAFRTSNSTDFGDAIDCISSTPDIVPIAVGCALAALVVIVLLAYLYGRRRSQARGYLSMFAENKQEEDYIPMKTLSCFR